MIADVALAGGLLVVYFASVFAATFLEEAGKRRHIHKIREYRRSFD